MNDEVKTEVETSCIKTPLTSLKKGDTVYIVWADMIEVGALVNLETYKKHGITWEHANIRVNYQGGQIIRKIGQDQLFCSMEEAKEDYMSACKRHQAILNKILHG